MYSVLRHLDGSGLWSLGFFYDDGQRYTVAYRVEQAEVERIKEEFAAVCIHTRGVDPALSFFPPIRAN